MTAVFPTAPHPAGAAGGGADAVAPGEASAVAPVVVRRRAGLLALIAAGASAVAIAYLWRASQTGEPRNWALFAAMAVLAALYLAALVDARTPLLVADDLGVRIRFGRQWRGLPWEAVDQAVVCLPQGRYRDGKLVVTPHSPGPAIEGLAGRAGRLRTRNQKAYGAALAVPLGLATRISADGDRPLADRLGALAGSRTSVVERVPEPMKRRNRWGPGPRPLPPQPEPGPGHPRPERGPGHPRPEFGPEPARAAVRAEVILDAPAAPGLPPMREGDAAHAAEPVAALLIDELAPEPVADPVIGPELTAARTRLGLSVDELSERTRIRPHVIEAIEVDDFAPCGGDVYARGHLRTLARVLGKDPDAMVRTFDDRYAGEPITARRVFQAELATGMTGGVRAAGGGASWGLLVAVVVTLLLVWTGVRLAADAPVGPLPVPVPIGNGPAAPK